MTIRAALFTYIALLALVALTVGSIFIPLGPLNGLINLGVAGTKAALIVLVFMHLRQNGTLSIISIVMLLVWLCILFGFTLTDYATR